MKFATILLVCLLILAGMYAALARMPVAHPLGIVIILVLVAIAVFSICRQAGMI